MVFYYIKEITNKPKLFTQASKLLSRRHLMNDLFKVPKVEQTMLTSHNKPAGNSSSSIKNGTKGEIIFPKGTLIRSFLKELPKAAGAVVSLCVFIWVWPISIVSASSFIHSVTYDNTASVKIEKFGAKPIVDILQTYAPLDKPRKDDE